MFKLDRGKKHVFIDWIGVEAGYGTKWPNSNKPRFTPSGVRIAVHKPVLETEPVFKPEKPWEQGCINGYATFMEDEGVIRCWYECFPAVSMDDMTSYLAYAESHDGINWKRPSLQIYDYNGSKDNNILMKAHGTCVFKDPTAPSSERYKLVWVKYDRNDPNGFWCKIYGATSPDGISWKVLPEPILSNPADTQTIVTYDEELGKYVMYTRQTYNWERRFNGYRRAISRSVTEDFSHWPEPEMVLTNDPKDPPDWDYYTNGYTRWPGANSAHMMFIDMYHRTKDTFDIHLATSRDGKLWYRPLGQEPWIANGPVGSFNDMMLAATSGIISKDNKWIMYIQCSQNGHNLPPDKCKQPYGGYWRAQIREDGITSVTADAKGEFWTTPFKFQGNCLKVNASVPYGGELKIGIVEDTTGEPIDEYNVDKCDPLGGYNLWKTVSWNGVSDISRLEGKPIRLHFKLFKSDVYAYCFDEC